MPGIAARPSPNRRKTQACENNNIFRASLLAMGLPGGNKKKPGMMPGI
jgi:hypothetical protein